MNEINVKRVTADQIHSNFLEGFNRHQITNKMKIWNKGNLEEKENYYIDDWDNYKLSDISKYLQQIALIGAVVAAFHEDKVVGFTCVDGELFLDGYMNMPYIHVSLEYRRKGIGELLFNMIQEEAKKLGATKLYISAHPDVNTQKFYESIGCVQAKRINKELYDLEPFDIQLEKELL